MTSRMHSCTLLSRLTQSAIAIQSELNDLVGLLPGTRRVMRLINREHAALVEALASRDAVLARRLAEQHVDSTNDLIIGLGLSALER